MVKHKNISDYDSAEINFNQGMLGLGNRETFDRAAQPLGGCRATGESATKANAQTFY
jgi:hypothetical protein